MFQIFVIQTDDIFSVMLFLYVIFSTQVVETVRWEQLPQRVTVKMRRSFSNHQKKVSKLHAKCTCIRYSSTINDYFVQKVKVFAPVITPNCFPVFRDILVRIRMLSFVPLTNGSGSVPKSSVTFRM